MTEEKKLQIETRIFQVEDMEPDTVEMQVAASVYEKEHSIYILYDVLDEDTKQSTSNRLKVHDKSLEIIGKGMTNSRMELTVGKVTAADYQTPFGRLIMEVHTNYLRVYRIDGNLRIEAEYELWNEEMKISRNVIRMQLN